MAPSQTRILKMFKYFFSVCTYKIFHAHTFKVYALGLGLYLSDKAFVQHAETLGSILSTPK